MPTAKRNKYIEPNRIPRIEVFLEDLLERLNKDRSVKINYTYSGGANYKCIITGIKQTDWINIPRLIRFKNCEHFYKTIFHELFHCIMDRTGISDRIDNNEDEEITAELCSMLLAVLLGINAWGESYKYIGDYLLNSGGYVIHKGRRDYIKECSIKLLGYVLKIH
jgi:hypothetical protein